MIGLYPSWTGVNKDYQMFPPLDPWQLGVFYLPVLKWDLCLLLFAFLFMKILFTYFWDMRREGERKKRWCVRGIWICCLSHTPPSHTPGLQPRRVPWLGSEAVRLCFVRWRPTHWAASLKPLFRWRSVSGLFFWHTTHPAITFLMALEIPGPASHSLI